MSTVFILKDDVSTFLAAAAGTDEAGKLAAYQTIVKNASVDSDSKRISIFLEDLGYVPEKSSSGSGSGSGSGGGGGRGGGGKVHSIAAVSPAAGPLHLLLLPSPASRGKAAALNRLFTAYMKNSTPINPGQIGSPMNPTCLGSGQQDTDEYLRNCILKDIPIHDSFKLFINKTISCLDSTAVIDPIIKNLAANLDIPITDANFENQSDINMIDKLIQFTNIGSTPPLDQQPRRDKKLCKDDVLANGYIIKQTRITHDSIEIPDENTYMILSLKILYADELGTTFNKYEGKITIAPSFNIIDGKFSHATGGIHYTLLGFTAHYGTWAGGHYVYYKKIKKEGDDNWVKISDTNISSSMSEADALTMNNDTNIQCKDFLYIKTEKQDDYFTKEILTKGFVNSTGSLCYMNSMNQLLLSMPEFVEYIIDPKNTPPPPHGGGGDEDGGDGGDGKEDEEEAEESAPFTSPSTSNSASATESDSNKQIERIVNLARINPVNADNKTCRDRPASTLPSGRPIREIKTPELDEASITIHTKLPIQDYFTASPEDKFKKIAEINTWFMDLSKFTEFKYNNNCYRVEKWKFYVDDFTSLTDKKINGNTLEEWLRPKDVLTKLDSADEILFVAWMRSIFKEIKKLHPSIPDIFTDDSIPIPTTASTSSAKSFSRVLFFPNTDITKKEYYDTPENTGKSIYIITQTGSTIANLTNPLNTIYPNLFNEANMKDTQSYKGLIYNGEKYIKSYYDPISVKDGLYKEVIDLIESQPITVSSKLYPAGSVFYINNDDLIKDDIRIRGMYHIKGIDFTGKSDILKLKSYLYIQKYYSAILTQLIQTQLIQSTKENMVIHLTAVPDDEITYRAIIAAVEENMKVADTNSIGIQYNLPMSKENFDKWKALGPPNESGQKDPVPDLAIEKKINILNEDSGKIIGPNGSTIKMLQSLTLADVKLEDCAKKRSSTNCSVIIKGRKKDVDIVETKINELLQNRKPAIGSRPNPAPTLRSATPTKNMYTALVVDDSLLKDYPAPLNKYTNILDHLHVTLQFKKDGLTAGDLAPVTPHLNKTVKIQILGRATNSNIDALYVKLLNLPAGITVKTKYPHITLRTADGVKPYESNTMLEKYAILKYNTDFKDSDFTFTKQTPDKTIDAKIGIYSNFPNKTRYGENKFRFKGGAHTRKRSRSNMTGPMRKSLRSSRETLATDKV